jgi:hypothetical protein
VALCNHLAFGCSDRAHTQTLVSIYDWELREYAPVTILLLLTKELDALVDFNVLLATDVRGLEFVIRHELNC